MILTTANHAKVDAIHRFCLTQPAADLPVTHRFTPGMYIREIFMPKGSLVVSKIHRTRHPFAILTGRLAVWDEASGLQQLAAGHLGITEPGTRRVLFMHEDTRWVTFHATDLVDPEAIEAEIIEPHTVGLERGPSDVTIMKLLHEEPL